MKKKIKAALYHFDKFLFEKLGYPKVKDEKISKRFLKKYLNKNPCIIDCGAHDGSDTIELAKIFGGTVYAFEPVENIFNKLTHRTSLYNNIHCYQIALSDRDGIQEFYVSEGESDGSSSLLEPKEHLNDHPQTHFNNKIEVTTLKLDSWAKGVGIKKVDMLWLDMQGYELKMLKASREILKNVKLIHTEVSTKETYKDVSLYDEYRAFLEDQGFSVVIEAIPTGWDMGNVVFVRKLPVN